MGTLTSPSPGCCRDQVKSAQEPVALEGELGEIHPCWFQLYLDASTSVGKTLRLWRSYWLFLELMDKPDASSNLLFLGHVSQVHAEPGQGGVEIVWAPLFLSGIFQCPLMAGFSHSFIFPRTPRLRMPWLLVPGEGWLPPSFFPGLTSACSPKPGAISSNP